jgi:sterol desaturase/sphingolipid hydroxylase (fatty acid hydroxylase superfamily)
MIQVFLTKLSPQAICAGSVIFFGYILFSSILQVAFYARKAKTVSEWKIQPEKMKHVGEVAQKLWIPILNNKPDRAPYHWLFASFNLTFASCCAIAVTELSKRRLNRIIFADVQDYGIVMLIFDFAVAVTYENIVEYYWHRLMHLRYFYGRFHKYHHFYKSPEPFDDMYIHPLEAIGYYFILFSPPFLFHMHYISFIGYMIVMGTCGVLDHCGVAMSCGVYDTKDHDLHHEKFDLNYCFPLPIMDILHGTYQGHYFGRNFVVKEIVSPSSSSRSEKKKL